MLAVNLHIQTLNIEDWKQVYSGGKWLLSQSKKLDQFLLNQPTKAPIYT